jgi:hypothetical protein
MIGRETEKTKLLEAFNSDNSEFVAVYGRRRVGKTYLIRETFNNLFVFQHSGLANATMKDQLAAWVDDIREAGLDVKKVPQSWLDAFRLLKELIKVSKNRKKVVFIDEMPWMDTPRSKFVMALEHFWNGWASARKDVLLIVCGSATSWIVNNIFKNHGGLHNRVTRRIHLLPFTLHECELYTEVNRLDFSRYQLLVGYMIMGGIPYYWSQLQKGLSLDQNIDELFFSENGSLRNEFNELYASLFRHPDAYIEVVATLGAKSNGMTREDLIVSSRHISDNGKLTQILQDLEYSGFIRSYKGFGKKVRSTIFQLTDHFSIFYFKFLTKHKENDPAFWTHNIGKPLYNAWCGLAFERVCLAHVPQIKRALGIGGIASNVYSWRSRAYHTDRHGAQIDLIIDRADQVINLCEMKFSTQEYRLDKEEMEKLHRRRALFAEETNTRKAMHLTMITTYGLEHNAYWGEIQKEITADNLMKE